MHLTSFKFIAKQIKNRLMLLNAGASGKFSRRDLHMKMIKRTRRVDNLHLAIGVDRFYSLFKLRRFHSRDI